MTRYTVARRILLFWTLFVGIGAVAGATGMLVAIDGSALGMQPILPYFQVLPFADVLFQNFLFPGISLLIVNGLTNLTAAVFLLRKKKLGFILGGIFGITLMMWICIQFVIMPTNFLSISYFIFGLLQAITGYCCLVFYKQETLVINPLDYPNVGSNKKELVVYFSRLGRVRKAAYETAEKSGAEIFRIQTTERTEGTLGFWWCGRFGMHKWGMPLESMPQHLEEYDKVTICTPIWVFSVCAPVREFCKQAKGKIKKADYVLVHFQPAKYQSVMDEMDELLAIKREQGISICSELGKNRYMSLN